MVVERNLAAQCQIRLFSTNPTYKDCTTSLSVTLGTSVDQLNVITCSLTGKSSSYVFYVNGNKINPGCLADVILTENYAEQVISVEFSDDVRDPELIFSCDLPDWVSDVALIDEYYVVGCYNGSLHFINSSGNISHTFDNVHSGPIKSIRSILKTKEKCSLITGGHDQLVRILDISMLGWNLNVLYEGHGHGGSVESIAVEPNNERFCTGSWDKYLKVWLSGKEAELEASERVAKQQKLDGSVPTQKVPLLTLEHHREAITAVCWPESSKIVTVSLDRSLCVWDLSAASVSGSITCSKAFLDLDWNRESSIALTGCTDPYVRIFDTRSKEGSMVKQTFQGHSGWVSCVRWCPSDHFKFISASYDNTVKLWDTRNPKLPVYNLRNHTDKVMTCGFTSENHIISGGADSKFNLCSL